MELEVTKAKVESRPGAAAKTETDAETEVDPSRLVAAGGQEVDFARDIAPILESKCIQCHGPEKPKGRFRLDNRESALKGGSQGIAVIPGNSADSPLIHFVARMVPDMEMPPEGKGEPVTPGEIALLRAWIDQGLKWDGDGASARSLEFTISPTAQWLSVEGNEQKFREQTWINEEWSGGIDRFIAEAWLDADTKFTAEGRAITGPENYKLKLGLNVQDVGFLRGGVEQFRRYYNNYGGYYDPFNTLPEPDPLAPVFTPVPGEELVIPEPVAAAYRLNRELHLDVGRAWAEIGFDRPLWPAITLGYEYRYKEGEKSSILWGPSTLSGETRRIYPAYKYINEDIQTFRADITYGIAGFEMENNFMAEFIDLETRRFEASPDNFEGVPTTFTTIDETHDSFQLSNTFSLQKDIRDWWTVSGGYYYSYLEADTSFQQNTFNGLGETVFGQQWFSRPIILDWDAHIFNVSTRLGAWKGLSLSAGVQSNWERQNAMGNSTLFFGLPDPTVDIDPFFLSTVGSSTQTVTSTEHATLRFDAIPRTVLFAQAELEQESTDYFEEDPGMQQNFLRDTELGSEEQDYRAGFTFSPWSRISLNSHYRYRLKENRYDHLRDQTSFTDFEGATIVLPTLGYPGFILGRDTETQEVKARINVRPTRWLSTNVSYQMQTTNFETVTSANTAPVVEEDDASGLDPIPPFVSPTDTVGGRVLAGEYNSHIYSLNFDLTPWDRLSLNTSFSFHDSHSRSADNGDPAVEDFDGDVYSVMVGGAFVLNKKTDISAYYTFSRGDFSQDDFKRPLPAADPAAVDGNAPEDQADASRPTTEVTGLPLGIEYDQHGLQAGITRQLSENLSANLQYRYHYYREPTAGGLNDFDAHGVYLNFIFNWK